MSSVSGECRTDVPMHRQWAYRIRIDEGTTTSSNRTPHDPPDSQGPIFERSTTTDATVSLLSI
jgi:hypothetical protein